jgi:hypothetical protein
VDLAPDGPVKDMLKTAGVEAVETQATEAAKSAVPLEVRECRYTLECSKQCMEITFLLPPSLF